MRAVLTDWAQALSEFPQWAIEEACQEYLRTQERKPTIAAIRKMAQQHFAVVEFTRQKAMRGPAGEERREFSEEHRAAMTRRMAEAGNQTLAAMQARMGGKT